MTPLKVPDGANAAIQLFLARFGCSPGDTSVLEIEFDFDGNITKFRRLQRITGAN